MITTLWLAVSKNGWRHSVRIAKKQPALKANEIAMKLQVEIPDAIFTKPLLEANIVVPKDVVNRPVITAEITDNIQEAIKQSSGIDVTLKLVDSE